MSKSAVHVKCWKCDQSFASNRERKNHMSSRDHNSLSVICPFCQKRRTFKRSTPEFRDHVRSHHPLDLAGLKDLYKEFFMEANGYWLSVYPRDYRVLTPPNDYEATVAMKTRDLVRAWLKRTGGAENAKALSEWEAGWPAQRNLTRSSSVEPESNFIPDYEEREPTPKRLRTEYTPDTPEMEIGTLTIQSILSNGEEGMQALLYTEGDNPVWYKATLSKDLYQDPKSVASIMRRAVTTKDAGVNPPIQMVALSTDVSASTTTRKLLCAVADTLGISKRYLQCLECGASFNPVVPTSSQVTSHAHPANAHQQQNLTLSDDGSPAISEPDVGASQNQEYSKSLDPKSKSTLVGLHQQHEAIIEQACIQESHEAHPCNVLALGTDDTLEQLTRVSPPIITDSVVASLNIPGARSISHPAKATSFSSPTIIRASMVSPTTVTASPRTIPKPSPNRSVQQTSSGPTMSGDAAASKSCTNQQRALDLLSRGCLPLFPPAPREWDVSSVIAIPCGFTQICWPPHGWKTLTKDQRKLQLEFTAMLLERQANQSMSASDAHREVLLSKYNMLTLPESDWPDRDGYRGLQYSNYEMLRKIAVSSNQKGSNRDEHFIRVLEAASIARDTSTDFIIDILDSCHLKLRLTM